jgi:glyoxylase-like metal-dependent hydrolase (beta-lactamase superfamily II)
VRERLMTEQTLWKKQHPPMPKQAWPTLTFDQSIKLFLNGEEVQIIHMVHGHTDGDTVVFFPQNKVVSMGDLYFSGMYPIFHPEHKGGLEGYAKNVKRVIDQISDDYKIVPGHGPLSNKAELEKYHRMILASIETVRRGIKAGRTLEQVQKAGLATEWESFSHGYLTTDRWLALVYDNLKN